MNVIDDLVAMASFAVVVSEGSFTAAAAKLNVSKSVVSRRVSSLEKRVGARLLFRNTRTLSLTELGRQYYEHSARVLEEAEAASTFAMGHLREPSGTLRVNAPMAFSLVAIAPLITPFLEQYPAVRVDLHPNDRYVDDLIRLGFDVTIRISGGSEGRELGETRLVVVGSPAYLRARGRPRTPSELVPHHNCLRYSLAEAEAEWRFQGLDGPISVPVRGNLEVSDGLFLLEAAMQGLGLAVLPEFMVREDLEAGRLNLVLEEFFDRPRRIFAVTTLRGGTPSPKVTAFLDFLEEHLRPPSEE